MSHYQTRNSCLIRGVITFKRIFIEVTFNGSVLTSKKTYCASNTRIDRLVLLMDITAVLSDKHDRQIPDKFGRKHVECMNVKENGIYCAVTAVLGKV